MAADAIDFNGDTMREWDKIRALCAKRDGSDLPRLMFEGLIDGFADLLNEQSAEIESLRLQLASARRALEFIADGYENHNINHVDYRVKVYQVATETLEGMPK